MRQLKSLLTEGVVINLDAVQEELEDVAWKKFIKFMDSLVGKPVKVNYVKDGKWVTSVVVLTDIEVREMGTNTYLAKSKSFNTNKWVTISNRIELVKK